MLKDLADWLDTFTWGSVADWLAAVGTLAAFLIAAVTYVRSYRDSKKSQARRITIRDSSTSWAPIGSSISETGLTLVKMVLSSTFGVPPTYAEAAAIVTSGIHNGTDEAIGPIRVEVVMEGSATDAPLASYKRRTLQPGQEFTYDVAFSDQWEPEAPAFLTRVTFQDAVGRWWQRTEGGPVSPAPRSSRFEYAAGTGRRLTPDEYTDIAHRHNRDTFS